MRRRPLSEIFTNEFGSVTAELALALPSVTLVIVITVASFGLQIERMKYVSIAAAASRALGRGEAQEVVTQLVGEMQADANLAVSVSENSVCATLSRKMTLPALGNFTISERQCSRKMGL